MSTSLPTIKINKKILHELGYMLEGTLYIPDTIDYQGKTYLITKIDKRGFKSCRKITSVSIPAAVKEIEPFAFARCTRLQHVEYRGETNNQLRHIHDNAFEWTRQTDICLPPNVLSLGRFAFADNFCATKISLSPSLRDIGPFAFSNCPNVEHIIIPDSVVSVGPHVFDGCEGLLSVKMSNSVKSLEEGVFADCWELKEFTVPEGVEKINLRAFDGCANMIHVRLPGSLQEIQGNSWLWQSCMQYFSYNGSRDDWKGMWNNFNHDRLPLQHTIKCLDGTIRNL